MNERPPLRVLMFTYYYPPLGGAGVQRSLKFSKYLPGFGITPSIISADSAGYTQDRSLMAEVPAGIEVLRLPHTPLVARLMALAPRRGSARGAAAPASAAASGPAPAPAPAGSASASPSHWRDRLLQLINTLQIPDDKAAWARQAQHAADDLMQRTPFDLVFSSSPPVSAHLAAMRLARRARVPWVADFRDMWTANPAYAAPAWRRWLDRRLEDRLLGAADGLVTVSDHLAALLAGRVGPRVPVMSIPNGYDEADFCGFTPAPRLPGIYRIVHAGTFYGHQSPAGFILGLERLFERDPSARARLRVRFVGNIGSRFEPLLTAFEMRHPEVLHRSGYVSHHQAVAEVLGADALLLVIGGDRDGAAGVMTGKLFEYLRAGRPILLLGATDGEAARLVREAGAGEVLGHGDPERVAALLSRWMAGGAPLPVPGRAAAYERRVLTGRLAEFMSTVHSRFHGRG